MHGKKQKRNTGHLSIIFDKNTDGSYTRNALLCQDILKYSIEGKYKEKDNYSFRIRNLAKWLLEVNQEFMNYFRDPSTKHFSMSNRVENRLDRIKDKVNDLIELNLIEEYTTTKETKGNSFIPIYRYTINGSHVALIIQSEDSTKREQSIENIYNLLQDYFKELPSSADIFYSIFYRKCRDAGLFGEIVAAYREIIRSNFPISHIPGFLQYLMIRPVGKMNIQIVKLWKDSLNELEPLTKALFLHNFKLDLERRMCTKVGFFREYEKMRFRVANCYDIVALEGYCSSCNCYTALGSDLMDYLEKIHLERRKHITASCPACKKGKSMVIPFLL